VGRGRGEEIAGEEVAEEQDASYTECHDVFLRVPRPKKIPALVLHCKKTNFKAEESKIKERIKAQEKNRNDIVKQMN